MGSIVNMRAKIKKYYKFTRSELIGFITSILVLSFIISFREWGVKEFNPIVGLFNWLNAALIVTLVFIIYNFAQRLAGWSTGFNAEYKVWVTGLLVGLIIAFLSKGRIWVLLPGSILIHHLAGHRLGHYRYGINYFEQGMVAVAGTISLITIAAIFKIINVNIHNPLLTKLITFCVILAIYDILPIPPLTGSKLFFGGRLTYIFLATTIVIAGILLLLDINVLMAVFGSIALGIICWFLYYIFFEHKAWAGDWAAKK